MERKGERKKKAPELKVGDANDLTLQEMALEESKRKCREKDKKSGQTEGQNRELKKNKIDIEAAMFNRPFNLFFC